MDPTVTAIMPTMLSRSRFFRQALESLLAQDYRQKSLLVVDGAGRHIGAARNSLCRMAHSDLIVHWDDDDWSHPRRLSDQVSRFWESGKGVSGFRNVAFYDERAAQAWLYRGAADYVVGTTLIYRREWWADHFFRQDGEAFGEDNDFVRVARDHNELLPLDGGEHLVVARIHDANTSAKAPGAGDSWAPLELSGLPAGFHAQIIS